MIEQIKTLFDLQQLPIFMENWGWLSYPILFAIIFAETGLLIGFFFPGDSLLFITGFAASTGILNIVWLNILLIIAAIVGDTVGYFLGRTSGDRIQFKDNSLFFKKSHLEKTQAFYNKHGGKTIVLARFVPIVRTFAPFVAGMANMNYKKFVSYNIFGGIAWITSMTMAGYFLGNVPIIKQNFEKAVLLIIFISLIPVFGGVISSRLSKK
ncbi:MAG TPA: VTT domain-containing protein [Oligoflexia bacterium]|nr:VTT domain-containing protein [Oligoflexia bacterium]HMR23858.1 VTT domain-containing protein [Oligoflexia bacterium]